MEETNYFFKSKVSNNTQDVNLYVLKCFNETENFYKTVVRYLIFGNILKNNTYPLSVSAERISQAVAIADYAKLIGADISTAQPLRDTIQFLSDTVDQIITYTEELNHD